MPATDGSPSEIEGTVHGFVQAFSMIIVSEIGDKTFLIAAILAMRHPRIVVFAGALGSLVVMSILSAAMGHILPTLIPKRWTQFAAGVLFIVFGAKLFREGRDMPSGNEKVLEEMREAEEEINEDVAEHDGTGRVTANGDVIPLEEIEAGHVVANGDARDMPRSPSALREMLDGTRNLCSFFLGPVFVQVFVLTFLGEWGDRSQIATIMLAAAHVSCWSRIHPRSYANYALILRRMYTLSHSERSLDTHSAPHLPSLRAAMFPQKYRQSTVCIAFHWFWLLAWPNPPVCSHARRSSLIPLLWPDLPL